MRRYTVAAAQMDSGPEKEINLIHMEGMIEEAGKRGASLIVFPETSTLLPSSGIEKEEGAEPVPGPSTDRLSKAAREAGIWVHSGSLLERIEGNEKCYNTSVLISPKGEVTAKYRKIHLFDVNVHDGPSVRESASYASGNEIVMAETPLGNIGMSICYDLRFPELYRILAMRGAQVLVVPACFTSDTGKEHWEPLLRARAIENLCYVVAPGQVGSKPRYRAHGKSMVVDPWGTVTACRASGEGLVLAEVDLDRLESLRHSVPCLQNRRPDAYDWR
ncbi:MAG: carbon-nitrogen hydrolase family protein [Synergistota bacterium]|nr:carbon-nitrogen hydrolase family protein [Synergistota bacterium]